MTPEGRFWTKVEMTDGCWLWTDSLHELGYARFWVDRNTRVYAHRYAYELKVGPIPDGMSIDHLCRVRHCVNPDHLEPVSHAENLRRSPIQPTTVNAAKTRCPYGHPYSGTDKRGWRVCNRCIAAGPARTKQEASA
jgi:hypothetical protein